MLSPPTTDTESILEMADYLAELAEKSAMDEETSKAASSAMIASAETDDEKKTDTTVAVALTCTLFLPTTSSRSPSRL